MHEKINLRYRSNQKELLDRDDIPFEDIRRNMQELNVINALLGEMMRRERPARD